MLLSVCAILKDIPPDLPFPGRAAHAIFLNLINKHDPELAKELHDLETRKPFTTSPLLENTTGKYLRFTTYSSSLSHLFLSILTGDPPSHIEVDNNLIPIEGWFWDNSEDFEGRKITYYELIGRWLSGRYLPQSIKLKFLSPTTFRSAGRNLPVPLPHLVFGSLMEDWNAYAPFALGEEVKEFINEAVAISGFRLHTELISLAGGKQVGFAGNCTYIVTKENPFAMACLHLLADFAFYASVGAKTTMGMGQTRRIG